MRHVLKIWPQFYKRVADGSKTFEVRHNADRGFQFGDTVLLREWDPMDERTEDALGSYDIVRGYTGKELLFKVGYVHQLKDDMVVFALLPIEEK